MDHRKRQHKLPTAFGWSRHRVIKELLEEAETILYEDSHTGEKFLMPAPSSDKVNAIYDNLRMRFIHTSCSYAE